MPELQLRSIQTSRVAPLRFPPRLIPSPSRSLQVLLAPVLLGLPAARGVSIHQHGSSPTSNDLLESLIAKHAASMPAPVRAVGPAGPSLRDGLPQLDLLRGDFDSCRGHRASSHHRAGFYRDIVPAFWSIARSTCARPLNSERRGSLSLSWQLGSPLPTPMSAPSPVTLNMTMFVGRRHRAPALSSASTVRTTTSSPSALIVVRSAVSRSAAIGPVVSRFSVKTSLPSFQPRASIAPAS